MWRKGLKDNPPYDSMRGSPKAELIIPEWDESVDWLNQIGIFSNLYKDCWRRGGHYKDLADFTDHHGSGGNLELSVKNKCCWSYLKFLVYKYQKNDSNKFTKQDDGIRGFFITCNLDEESTVVDAYEMAQEIVSSKWVIDWSYIIEYYGADNNHAHCHILLHTKEFKSTKALINNFIRKDRGTSKLKFRFASMNKHMKATNFMDFREEVECHGKYVVGVKDVSKMDRVELDKALCESYGIPHMVSSK